MLFHETVDSAATDGVPCYGVYRQGIRHLLDSMLHVSHTPSCSPSYAGREFNLCDYGMFGFTSFKYGERLFYRHGQQGKTIRVEHYQQKNIA